MTPFLTPCRCEAQDSNRQGPPWPPTYPSCGFAQQDRTCQNPSFLQLGSHTGQSLFYKHSLSIVSVHILSNKLRMSLRIISKPKPWKHTLHSQETSGLSSSLFWCHQLHDFLFQKQQVRTEGGEGERIWGQREMVNETKGKVVCETLMTLMICHKLGRGSLSTPAPKMLSRA